MKRKTFIRGLAGLALCAVLPVSANRVMNRAGVVTPPIPPVTGLLPLSRAYPVWYDNDDTRDSYSLEHGMVSASGGLLKLVGISTSSSIQPYNQYVSSAEMDNFQRWRNDEIVAGRQSGLVGIPDQVPVNKGNLVAGPGASTAQMIDNTAPANLPAATAILAYVANPANGVTPTNPLLICCGGPLTIPADVYVRNRAIADRIIVVWLGSNTNDNRGFNGWADAWAGVVCTSRLKMCIFPLDFGGGPANTTPLTPKSWIEEDIPASPLKDLMRAKVHPTQGALPFDGDAPPLLMVMEPSYVTSVQRKRFSGLIGFDGKSVPTFQNDAAGNLYVVTGVIGGGGTTLFRAPFLRPQAWNGGN